MTQTKDQIEAEIALLLNVIEESAMQIAKHKLDLVILERAGQPTGKKGTD